MTVLITVNCYKCNEPFGIEQGTRRVFLRSHQNFFCPFGHPQHYIEGDSEETKLRRERDRLKQNAAYLEEQFKRAKAQAEHERRRANGYKGHATRITKRAKAGVCPCCNRSFVALARHMKTQHPDFTAETPDPVPLKLIEGGIA